MDQDGSAVAPRAMADKWDGWDSIGARSAAADGAPIAPGREGILSIRSILVPNFRRSLAQVDLVLDHGGIEDGHDDEGRGRSLPGPHRQKLVRVAAKMAVMG